MSKLIQYTWQELKLVFRVPIGLFFTLIFPQILLISLTLVTKNQEVAPGIFFVDIYIPLAAIIALMSCGIISFASLVAANREQKLWVSYQMRGFKLYQIIIAPIIVNILVCFVSTILLIISGVALFRANIPQVTTILLFLIVWLVFAVAIFLIGFVIGTISNSGKAAQSISTVIMFTLMILSGFFMDYNSLPDNIKLLSDLLVTTQANKILVYFWNMEGTSFDGNWVVVIAWLLITSFIVTVKLRKDNFKRV